jgi:hypothetical protein
MSLKDWWSRRMQLTDTQAARLENTRDLGRRRFVIVDGVLRFGVCCAVLNALVAYLLGWPGTLWGRLAVNLVVFSVGGIWHGKRMWTHHERRYAEWRRRSSADTHHLAGQGIAQ